MMRCRIALLVPGAVVAAVLFATGAAKAHVWKDIYGPNVRDHDHHVHLPHFVSSYYYSSRPHDPHHGLPPHAISNEGACGDWHRRCSANWGLNNADYRGCMKHHGCY